MATMKAAARSSMARAGLAAGEGAAGGDKAPGAAGGAERGAARRGTDSGSRTGARLRRGATGPQGRGRRKGYILRDASMSWGPSASRT